MKWIVPGPNTKVLAHAIHCLAKMGEDLYIDGLPDKLSFRTVNFSKTAFTSFNFSPDFFSFYPSFTEQDNPQCQISMKAALIVFRFPSGMEKCVEHCAINLAPNDNLVEFRLKYKHGFVKTNKIQLLECEGLQASYETEQLPSQLIIEPKILHENLSCFQCPEITWAVSHVGIQLRNFSELQDDGSGLRSEVHVAKEQLIDMSIVSNAELTFCLPELRTIIAFAENIGCPIICSYSDSGKPIFFIIRNDVLTAHVVLSTLGLSASQSTAAGTSVSARHDSSLRIDEDDDLMFNAVPQNVLESSQETSQVSQGMSQILKRVFKRTKFDITKLPGYDEILAPDSDEEMQLL